MIFLCLRHWVHNYHVDGFRFDLASILSRDRNGELVPNPPLVETIAEDPLLADTKIIAEAWDAAGGYQVGSFGNLRWAEWNGRYRDDMRRFWRGDPAAWSACWPRGWPARATCIRPAAASRTTASTSSPPHDGFTLNDLVSYSDKHNEANGEQNRDGENNNYSYNYGAEGPTRRRRRSRQLRLRQIRNLMATLLLSQGVPMLLAGDECRRTQLGNNNAYCQDNAISWFDWRLVEEHPDLLRFCQACRLSPAATDGAAHRLLARRAASARRMPDVSWFKPQGGRSIGPVTS